MRPIAILIVIPYNPVMGKIDFLINNWFCIAIHEFHNMIREGRGGRPPRMGFWRLEAGWLNRFMI